MTRWEEDQEQIKYLEEWRRTHKRWIVKIHDLTPAWEECRHYFKIRYFAHERTARMYAAWMRLWYPKEQVELVKEQ